MQWAHTEQQQFLVESTTAFFNYNYFSKMINIPDKIVLAKIMTALDLEFERLLHYHDEN